MGNFHYSTLHYMETWLSYVEHLGNYLANDITNLEKIDSANYLWARSHGNNIFETANYS